MRTTTIKVYKFKELSPQIQEKVINKFRDNNDFPFLEEELNDFLKENLKKNKIIIDNFKAYYSLGYHQGDGFCFVGVFRWKKYKINISHNSHYYHKRSTNIELTNEKTGDYVTNEKIINEFLSLYYGICDKCEKKGYEIIDYENSEKTIKENIELNDYEFYDNGDIYP